MKIKQTFESSTTATASLLIVLALCLTAGCPDDDVVGTTASGIDTAVSTPDAAPTDNGTTTPPSTDSVTTEDGTTVAIDPPIASPPPGGKCDYVASDQGAGKAFGEGCTKNADCLWSECLEPAEGGNITNEVFGFCTRGCDCGTTETVLTPEQKSGLMCIYPPGNQRKWAHVVVRCGSLSDCTALDSRWTDCRLPHSGGVQAICHADAE